jgi:hypothetical protein
VLSEIIASPDRSIALPEYYAPAFGVFTMSMKIALGLSAAIAGSWLSLSSQTIRADPVTLGPLAWCVFALSLIAGAWLWHGEKGRTGADIRETGAKPREAGHSESVSAMSCAGNLAGERRPDHRDHRRLNGRMV